MKYAIALVVVGGQFATLLATGGGLDITSGAMLGITATWIGIVSGYFHIRRSLIRDRDAAIERVSAEVVNQALTKRAATFMDRTEQTLINQHNTERYQTLTNFGQLAQEIRYLTQALERAIVKDENERAARDGR